MSSLLATQWVSVNKSFWDNGFLRTTGGAAACFRKLAPTKVGMGRMPRAFPRRTSGALKPREASVESVYLTQTSPIPFEQQKPPHIWGTYIYIYRTVLSISLLKPPFWATNRQCGRYSLPKCKAT